jgi:hypothetical protein
MVLVNWARSVPPHAKNEEKSAMSPEWQHLLEPSRPAFIFCAFAEAMRALTAQNVSCR